MADSEASEVLKVLNDPKMWPGEKMRKAAALTGTPFYPHGPGWQDVMRCKPQTKRSVYRGRGSY